MTVALAAVTAASAIATPATASDFMVEPVSVHIEKGQSTQTLSIDNRGDSIVRLQVTGFAWEQTTASDMKLDPTDELVFFPQMLEVAPGQHRAVRVGITAPGDGKTERTYRIFVEELPSLASQIAPKSMGVGVRMKLGIPIFVDPEKPAAKGEVVIAGMHDGRLNFELANHGNAHLLAQRIDVVGKDSGGATVFDTPVSGWDVLAGREHNFTIPVAHADCTKTRDIEISVRSDSGSYHANAPLATTDCK